MYQNSIKVSFFLESRIHKILSNSVLESSFKFNIFQKHIV